MEFFLATVVLVTLLICATISDVANQQGCCARHDKRKGKRK
jgi:hypothetical protein